MNRNNKTGRKSEKWMRFFFIIIILCAEISLLSDLAGHIVSVMGGVSFSLNRAASIGVIGGADGPTSILIMSEPASFWQTAFEAVILLVGILGLRSLSRK